MENNDQPPARLAEFLQLPIHHELDNLLEQFDMDIQFDDNDNILQEQVVIVIEPQQNEDLNASFDSDVFSDSDSDQFDMDIEFDDNDHILQEQHVIVIEPQQNEDLNASFESGVFSDCDSNEDGVIEDIEGNFLLDHALGLM